MVVFSLYAELLVLFYFVSKIKLGWKGYLLLMLGLLILTRGLNYVLHLDEEVIVERHLKMILIDLNIFMLGCFFAKFNIFKWLHERCHWLYKKIYLAPLLLVIPILVRAYLPLIGVTELLIVPMFCIGIVNVCKIGGVKSYFFWKTFIESLACSFILHFLFFEWHFFYYK